MQGVIQEQMPMRQSKSFRENGNVSVGHGPRGKKKKKNPESGFDMKKETDDSGEYTAKGNAHSQRAQPSIIATV